MQFIKKRFTVKHKTNFQWTHALGPNDLKKLSKDAVNG